MSNTADPDQIAYEPGHSISYKIAYASSKDSDQSAHWHSVIRVVAGNYVGRQGSKAASDREWSVCMVAR